VSKRLKDISVVSFLTVVSRLLGLVRDSLSAAVFGAGAFYSAFLTAFVVPNLFRRLLAEGSLTAAFVPTFQEALHKEGKQGALNLLSQVASWLVTITGIMTCIAMLTFSHSRSIQGQEDKWYLAADLTVILFPYLAFIALAAAFNAALNILDHFLEPALSPTWLNLAMIASIACAGLHFAHTPLGQVHWLCAGVLVGGFFQMTVPALILMREGWRPHFDLKLAPHVKEIAYLMAPGIFGTAIYQINIAVSRFLAFSLDDASATFYFMGNRLMEFPIGVFAIAVSTVVYPLIAKHAVEKNFDLMAEDFRKGLRLILIINVPAAVGLVLLSHPIVNLIYRHGRFTVDNATQLSLLVALFAIGMPFFSVVNLTIRAFYSVKDTKTPVKVATIDFVLNVVLSITLMHVMGVKGLVIASTSAIIVQTILLQRALVKKLPNLTFRPLWVSLLKVIAATALMACVVAVFWHYVDNLNVTNLTKGFFTVGIIIPAAIIVYGSLLFVFKIEGREELVALVKRKLVR